MDVARDDAGAPQRVCLIITTMATGGAQETVVGLASGLADAGVDVTLLHGPDGTGALDMHRERLREVDVRLVRWLRRRPAPLADLLALVTLRRTLRRGRYDIIHTHSTKAGLVGRVAAMAAGGSAVVHTVHGWGFAAELPSLVRRVLTLAERRLAPRTDAFVVVTGADLDTGARLGIGNTGQYHVIRSGIDLDRFGPGLHRDSARHELGLPDDAMVVGTVGRLAEPKDPSRFVALAQRARAVGCEACFVWAGAGPLEEGVRREVRAAGLEDQVRLIGERRDVERVLSCFDVFVQLSRWEALPRALVEAMASGLPVVATNVGGVAELVDQEVGALIGDPVVDEAWAAVRDLLEDPERRRLAGDVGRWRVRGFDVRVMVEDHLHLYRHIVRHE